MHNVLGGVVSPEARPTGDVAEPAAGRGGVARIVAVLGSAALLAGLVVLLYSASVHAVPGNSDGATVLLEGQAMSAGHLTLHHWYLSLDSFWGVDAPVYALGVLLLGVRPELLNLVPAVLAASIVVLGMWLATDRRRGLPAAAGAIGVLALLAFPSHALSYFYLQGPLHVGTALWCLGAFALLCTGYSRLRWAAAVVILAAGSVGDLQTLAFGVVPLALAGVLAALRTRRVRDGVPEVSAAGASVLLAYAVREVAKVVGTFTVNKSNPTATHREMLTNLKLAVTYGDKLLGVGSTGFGTGGTPSALLAVHVLGVLGLAAGVVAGIVSLAAAVVRGPRGAGGLAPEGSPAGDRSPRTPARRSGSERWRLDDVLLLAFFGDVATFVILTPAANPAYARYLTAAIVFGAVLAGRYASRAVARLRGRVAPAVALGGLVATTACFASALGFNLAQSPPPQPYSALAAYLAAHGLTEGIGDYWSSSIVTVESRDEVRVRPVTAPFGKIVVYTRNSSSTWYDGHSFQFLVYNPLLAFGNVDSATATATYGRPSRTVPVAGFLVLEWTHRITVRGHSS